MMLEDDICRACWGTSLPLPFEAKQSGRQAGLLLEPDPWGWSGSGVGVGDGADPWVVEAVVAVTEDL